MVAQHDRSLIHRFLAARVSNSSPRQTRPGKPHHSPRSKQPIRRRKGRSKGRGVLDLLVMRKEEALISNLVHVIPTSRFGCHLEEAENPLSSCKSVQYQENQSIILSGISNISCLTLSYCLCDASCSCAVEHNDFARQSHAHYPILPEDL